MVTIISDRGWALPIGTVVACMAAAAEGMLAD
jgi:hypothetical protein